MSFDIQVKIDPNGALPAIRKVEDGLNAAEKKAKELSRTLHDGMAGAARGFASLGTAIQQQKAALDRNAESHRFLNSTTHAAALGFSKMAEAIRREQEMLERIHGPTRQHIADLQTLDSLLKRGAISQAEYNRTASSAVAPSSASGGGMSAIRNVAAVAGVGIGASQVIDLADGYTQLQNRLRQMTPDQAAANDLLEKLSGIASRSRSDIGATADAFASMSRATRQLGMSQGETLAVTETLNKLVAASGRSAAESSAGLLQFGQALSSGRLQGDELRSVFETMPSLVEALMSSLGKTQAELREMGSAGQITSKVMIDALKGAAASADASLGKTIPTIGQHFTQMKNKLLVELGPALEGLSPIVGGLGDVLGGAIGVVKTGLIPVQAIGSAIGALGPAGTAAAAALTAIAVGNPIGIIATAAIGAATALNELSEALGAGGLFDNLSNDVGGLIEKFEKWETLQDRVTEATTVGSSAWREATTDLAAFNLQMMIGTEAAEAFRKAATPSKWQFAPPSAKSVEAFMGVGELDKAVDGFNKLAAANENWFVALDGTHKRSVEMQRERMNAVSVAKQELAALDAVWKSTHHGGLTTDLYNQQKKALLATINGTVGGHKKEKEALDEYAKTLASILAPQKEAIGQLNILGQLHMNNAITLEEYNNAAAKHRDLLIEIGMLEIKSQTGGPGSVAPMADVAALPTPGTGADVFDMATFRKNMALARDGIVEMQDALDRINAEKARDEFHKLGQTLRPVSDSLIDMFKQWDFSAEKFSDTLKDVAIQLLKVAAIDALGGSKATGGAAVLVGMLGGRNGFDYMANSDALQLPGFARGGSMTVQGSGSQDSHLLMARVSAGESVHVRTPQQRMAEEEFMRARRGGSQAGRQKTTINIVDDRGMVIDTLGSYEADKVYAKKARKMGRRRTG